MISALSMQFDNSNCMLILVDEKLIQLPKEIKVHGV